MCRTRSTDVERDLLWISKKLFWSSSSIVPSNITFQKKLFWNLDQATFLTVGHDLYILSTYCAYIKCSLEPRETFNRTYSIRWHKKRAILQEKVIFVDFKKMTLRNIPKKCDEILDKSVKNEWTFQFPTRKK